MPRVRNLCQIQENKDFSFMFSISGFIVLGFTFRSVIHLEFLGFGTGSFFACDRPITGAPLVGSVSSLRQEEMIERAELDMEAGPVPEHLL